MENIEFLDDRTVHRRVSVDYESPREAVALRRSDGDSVRIIPLTAMRRKSLTNFDLRDEANRPMPLLGLREAQSLTLALARCWAGKTLSAKGWSPKAVDRVDPWLQSIVTGDQSALNEAYVKLSEAQRRQRDDDPLAVLGADLCFMAVIDRLAGSFILFTIDCGPPGARRIVKLSYDEPLTLRYSTTSYHGRVAGRRAAKDEHDEQWTYGRGGRRLRRLALAPLLAGLGLTPTRIRFPAPAAELASSFHLEVSAPPEVTIVEASLLAGLPNLYWDPNPAEDKRLWHRSPDRPAAPDDERLLRRPSFDSVTGGYPTVDLHVADVPYGSLSRAQVKLQASAQGWLATAVAGAWLATGTLLGASLAQTAKDETATVVLATLAAAIVAVIVRPDPHRMVTRLLSFVRGLAGLSTILVFASAVAFAFFPKDAKTWLWFLFGASVVPAVLVTGAWVTALRNSTRDHVRPKDRQSPWEQHAPQDVPVKTTGTEFHVELARVLTDADYPYDEAVERLHFDAAAIKVASAEGVRGEFPWTREFRKEFFERLDASPRATESRRQR